MHAVRAFKLLEIAIGNGGNIYDLETQRVRIMTLKEELCSEHHTSVIKSTARTASSTFNKLRIYSNKREKEVHLKRQRQMTPY